MWLIDQFSTAESGDLRVNSDTTLGSINTDFEMRSIKGQRIVHKVAWRQFQLYSFSRTKHLRVSYTRLCLFRLSFTASCKLIRTSICGSSLHRVHIFSPDSKRQHQIPAPPVCGPLILPNIFGYSSQNTSDNLSYTTKIVVSTFSGKDHLFEIYSINYSRNLN